MLVSWPRWNIRTRALGLAVLAVVPWPVGLLAAARPEAFVVIACAFGSILACVLLARVLSPFARAASEIRELATADGAAACGFEAGDALTMRRGLDHLKGRVDSLRHRWIGRHSLTGLPVREALIVAIEEDLERADRPALVGAVRFVDYNRLTAFDPATADIALTHFANRLATTLGPGRPMAHVDRDSFAIWFRGPEPEVARMELQAICYALGAEITAGDLTLAPEIEVGTALYPVDALEPVGLINHALVSFAKPGAEATCAPSPGTTADIARERFALEQDLRHAIEREQFEMAFQPVVDLSAGLVGAEALLRWRHPEAGMISPARFIPILEDADLIDEIGRWTLNAACREMRRWQQRGLTGLRVAVNLSAAQLRDPTLKQMVQRTLERHRLSPRSLELELTETAATEDSRRTFELFAQLRALGVTLAIDDFGSGYSSLSYLKNLPFDKLKIDREFVVDVHLRKDSQAICRSLVELTRGLGLKILAEGVESWDEVAMLHQIGCDTFQGYLFSEPVDADQFINLAVDPEWKKAISAPWMQPESAAGRMSA